MNCYIIWVWQGTEIKKILKDSTSSAKKAKVSASQSGVWRYRSKHAVVASDGSKTLRNLTTLTDW